jgi:hypothetical protein
VKCSQGENTASTAVGSRHLLKPCDGFILDFERSNIILQLIP